MLWDYASADAERINSRPEARWRRSRGSRRRRRAGRQDHASGLRAHIPALRRRFRPQRHTSAGAPANASAFRAPDESPAPRTGPDQLRSKRRRGSRRIRRARMPKPLVHRTESRAMRMRRALAKESVSPFGAHTRRPSTSSEAGSCAHIGAELTSFLVAARSRPQLSRPRPRHACRAAHVRRRRRCRRPSRRVLRQRR